MMHTVYEMRDVINRTMVSKIYFETTGIIKL